MGKLVAVLGAVLALAPSALLAQVEDGSQSGFLLHERVQGSASAVGLVAKYDTSVGYQFNRYLAVEGGLPVYTVAPSSTETQLTGVQGRTGIGNAYGDARFTLKNSLLDFTSLLSVAAPTGNKAAGFSTGHVTYDWTNLFDHSFDQLTPFAAVGISNTITDTPFFTMPFTSYGFNAHLEGGAMYRLTRLFSVGGSGYAILPSGQQTVFSKIVTVSAPVIAPGSGNGHGRGHHGVFETVSQTVGAADITRDEGFSAWVTARLTRHALAEAGYSRSVGYSLNSVFFGIDLSLGPLLRGL